jgi:hypothetical protein
MRVGGAEECVTGALLGPNQFPKHEWERHRSSEADPSQFKRCRALLSSHMLRSMLRSPSLLQVSLRLQGRTFGAPRLRPEPATRAGASNRGRVGRPGDR